MERCFGERYTSTVSDGGNVFKKKVIIAAVAATALFGTAVTATAADNPGLVPKKVWNSKVDKIKDYDEVVRRCTVRGRGKR
jgi:hypothetical protein